MTAIAQLFRVPPPDERVRHWHISPLIDAASYHFSWLWVLVPMAMIPGDDRYTDYYLIFAGALLLGFSHRHFTIPYVYLDRQVFERFPARFAVVPALLFAAFLLTPSLYFWKVPPGYWTPVDLAAGAMGLALVIQLLWGLRGEDGPSLGDLGRATAPAIAAAVAHLSGLVDDARSWIWLAGLGASWSMLSWRSVTSQGNSPLRWLAPGATAAAIAGLALWPGSGEGVLPGSQIRFRMVFASALFIGAIWNVWHTLMQKYGILRLYNAKSEAPPDQRVPGWVDRLLLFGWFPLLVVHLGSTAQPQLAEAGKRIGEFLAPLVDGVVAASPWLYPPTIALAAGSVIAFVVWEWRVNRLRNAPRLSMGAGTVLLTAGFFVLDPVKVYIAYGFSHAVEYMVFVWAYTRRRYAAPLAHDPPMGRLMKHPALAWLGVLLVVGGLCFWFRYGHNTPLIDEPQRVFGYRTLQLVFYWTIWQQFMHYYYDGFLWKMRLQAVRANI